MKKEYEKPEMEIILFEIEDIIASSPDNEGQYPGQWDS